MQRFLIVSWSWVPASSDVSPKKMAERKAQSPEVIVCPLDIFTAEASLRKERSLRMAAQQRLFSLTRSSSVSFLCGR